MTTLPSTGSPLLPAWLRLLLVEAQFRFGDHRFTRLSDLRVLVSSTRGLPRAEANDGGRAHPAGRLEDRALACWSGWRARLPGEARGRTLHIDWSAGGHRLRALRSAAMNRVSAFIDTDSGCRTVGSLLMLGLEPADELAILLAADDTDRLRGERGLPATTKPPTTRGSRDAMQGPPCGQDEFSQRLADACAVHPMSRGEHELRCTEPRLTPALKLVLRSVLPERWTRDRAHAPSLERALQWLSTEHPHLALAALAEVEAFVRATETERLGDEVASLQTALCDPAELGGLPAVADAPERRTRDRTHDRVSDQPLPRFEPTGELRMRAALRHAYLPQTRELACRSVLALDETGLVAGTALEPRAISAWLACVGAPRSRFVVETPSFRAMATGAVRERLRASFERMEGHLARGMGSSVETLALIGGHATSRVASMLRSERVRWIGDDRREFVLRDIPESSPLVRAMSTVALLCGGIDAIELRHALRRHPAFLGHDWSDSALLAIARLAAPLRTAGGVVFASSEKQATRTTSVFARAVRRAFERFGPVVAGPRIVAEAVAADIPVAVAQALLAIHPLLTRRTDGLFSLARARVRHASDALQREADEARSGGQLPDGGAWTLSQVAGVGPNHTTRIAFPEAGLGPGPVLIRLQNGLSVRARTRGDAVELGARATALCGLRAGDAVLLHRAAGDGALRLAGGRRSDLEPLCASGPVDLATLGAHGHLLLPN